MDRVAPQRNRFGFTAFLLSVAISALMSVAFGDELPNPKPSQIRLPFLRRYAKPAKKLHPKTHVKPAQKKKKNPPAKVTRAKPSAHPKAAMHVVPHPVASGVPVAHALAPRTPLPRTPPSPTAYSASPAGPTNPNPGASGAVLPLRPRTLGKKDPPKTILLDMTRPY